MLNFKNIIDVYDIKIPMIQRDYAQGRDHGKAIIIRKDFLNKIAKRLGDNENLHLDFVYGIIKNKCFIPLDGQQRLTTLFLLYWYFGKKESKDIEYLKSFTYETRSSSREFCLKLVNCEIEFSSTPISEQIKDSSWFLAFWENDPTIKAMLTMLDAINDKFKNENYFDKLNNISFEFFELEKFNLDDDLYIKMNARGKELTQFEIFKANFEEFLDNSHSSFLIKNDKEEQISVKDYFAEKVDNRWLDFFWKNRYGQEIGIGIMRYFHFITEFLYFKNSTDSITTNPFEYDKKNNPIVDIERIKSIYESRENLQFLFSSFDFLCKMSNTDAYFSSLFSNNYKEGRVALFEDNINLVKSCITGKSFDIKEKILLFTILDYSLKFDDFVVCDNLKDIIRIVRNLLLRVRYRKNARFLSNLRTEYLTAQILFICNNLISNANVYEKLNNDSVFLLQGTAFTPESFEYERVKSKLIVEHIRNKKVLHKLEDHALLMGCIHNFDLVNNVDKLELFTNTFYEIFNEGENAFIIAGMLCGGDYTLHVGWSHLGARYFLGLGKEWWTILSSQEERVKTTLLSLLNSYSALGNGNVKSKLELIRQEYLNKITEDAKKSWEYLFIKYPEVISQYCGQSQITRNDDNSVLNILKGQVAKSYVDLRLACCLEELKNSMPKLVANYYISERGHSNSIRIENASGAIDIIYQLKGAILPHSLQNGKTIVLNPDWNIEEVIDQLSNMI